MTASNKETVNNLISLVITGNKLEQNRELDYERSCRYSLLV